MSLRSSGMSSTLVMLVLVLVLVLVIVLAVLVLMLAVLAVSPCSNVSPHASAGSLDRFVAADCLLAHHTVTRSTRIAPAHL